MQVQTNRDVRNARIATPFGAVDLSFSIGGARSLGYAEMPRYDSDAFDALVDRLLVNLPAVREDATSSMAFARGLEYIYKEVYEIEFPELRATDFIPLNTEVPAGALTYTYRMYEKTGAAAVIHNYADDLPLVGYKGKEFPAPIVTIGAAYSFSVVDIERAARLEVPLEEMLASACRWAIEYLGEQIAALGLSNEGVVGLTTVPGINATMQVSTGTWLAQIAAIGAATASEPAAAVAVCQGIISDVNAMKYTVRTQTLGMYAIDTVLLSLNLYAALEAVPRSPAFTNDNLLDYIEAICHVEVDFWNQLNAAGNAGNGRVMAYKKDPRCLKLVQARPFTQFAPQPRNLAWVVPCISELGGVNVIRPLTMTYMDNLDTPA